VVSGHFFKQMNGIRDEPVITTKCPEVMSFTSHVQNELNSR